MIKTDFKKYTVVCFMAVLLLTRFIPTLALAEGSSEVVAGNVVIDGSNEDWSGVSGISVDGEMGDTACVSEWKLAYSADGTKVLISYEGITPGCYYTDFLERNLIVTQNGNSTPIRVGNLAYYGSMFSMKYVNEAESWGTPGKYSVEISIDKSYFTDENFTLAITGATTTSAAVSAADIPTLSGSAAPTAVPTQAPTAVPTDSPSVTPGEDEPVITPNPTSGADTPTETPVNPPADYSGIVVDGEFSDWDGVPKHDASCPNSQHPNCLDKMAAVFDGDYVYIYVDEGTSASGAGSHSNGMFSIVTDLGRNLVFQLNPEGTVSGPEGVICKKQGDRWEIAIPKESVPQYKETISVGLYQGEMFVENIPNMQGGGVGNFEGIVYDGLFADWDSYPHTLIQYATAGTQEVIADGEGALYSDGDVIYGHVVSPMIAHLAQGGGELTRNITILFNEDYNTAFYPRLVAVDENGNINWNPKLQNLEPGKYEFYIASLDAWGTSKNISELYPMDTMYGKMTVVVRGEGQADEAEFYLDLPLIADKLGMDIDELKTVSGKFGEIGHEFVVTAGASSGAWLGIAVSLATVGAVLYGRRRKETEADKLN